MDSEILGLPMFASPADIESVALLWWAPFDLQHPWQIVTRLSQALSRHRLSLRRSDMFGNRNFPMHLLLCDETISILPFFPVSFWEMVRVENDIHHVLRP